MGKEGGGQEGFYYGTGTGRDTVAPVCCNMQFCMYLD